jgi:cell division septation protein DedD
MADNIAAQKRRGTLTLNRLQVGVVMGFVAMSLLVTFGAGFIIGMWYRGSEQITPLAAREPPSSAPEPSTRGQDMTFYTTLDPEPPEKSSGTVSTVPPRAVQSARGGPTAPPPQPVSLAPPKAPVRGGNSEVSPLQQKPGPSSTNPEGRQPSAEAGYSVQVGSFRAREEAEQLRHRLTQKGYPVWVQPSIVTGQGIWYRVRVGHFPDRATADRAAQRLASQERVSIMVTAEPGAR